MTLTCPPLLVSYSAFRQQNSVANSSTLATEFLGSQHLTIQFPEDCTLSSTARSGTFVVNTALGRVLGKRCSWQADTRAWKEAGKGASVASKSFLICANVTMISEVSRTRCVHIFHAQIPITYVQIKPYVADVDSDSLFVKLPRFRTGAMARL